MADDPRDFTEVPPRMKWGLLSGAAAAVFLGIAMLGDSATDGFVLIASSLGPLFVLLHARRRARTNRERMSSHD